MVLFDGKQVELGMWDNIADEFVGPDLHHAIITLLRLQKVMDNRYAWLRAHRRRKIEPGDGLSVITSIFDEIALFATVLGTEADQRLFVSLLRDLVARGRAAAMPVIAATQRPSRGHHPQEPARHLRLPRRVPLHLHRQLQHHPRRRPVRSRLLRHRHQPHSTPAKACSSPKAASPSASRSPTSPTPTSSPWPTTPPGPAAPGPTPTAGPAIAVA